MRLGAGAGAGAWATPSVQAGRRTTSMRDCAGAVALQLVDDLVQPLVLEPLGRRHGLQGGGVVGGVGSLGIMGDRITPVPRARRSRLLSPDRRRVTQRVGRGDWPAETLRAMAAASGDLSVGRGRPCRRTVGSAIAARIPSQAERAPVQAARTCLGATRVGTTDFAASSA